MPNTFLFSLLGAIVSKAPAETDALPLIGSTPDIKEISATTALFDFTLLAINLYTGKNICVFFAQKDRDITTARSNK